MFSALLHDFLYKDMKKQFGMPKASKTKNKTEPGQAEPVSVLSPDRRGFPKMLSCSQCRLEIAI